MIDKPFSQACENNKAPILSVLSSAFSKIKQVLEIGSGTGQHAVYFAHNLPHLHWQCADKLEYHAGIKAWLDEAKLKNAGHPVEINFPESGFFANSPDNGHEYDGYFTANTAHIMQKNAVEFMMNNINQYLPSKGVFCQYGPFIENGQFSSQSNYDFHHSLLDKGYGGYRSIEELKSWVPDLSLTEKINMPANNLMLIWQRRVRS